MSYSISATMPPDISRFVENKLFQNILPTLKRPGSAPPQMDELPGSPMASAYKLGTFATPYFEAESLLSMKAPDSSGLVNADKLRAYLEDPDYVQFYYANRNINPRLPPPINAGRDHMHSNWPGDFSTNVSNAIPDAANTHAAVSFLLEAAAKMSFSQSESNAIPIPSHGSFISQDNYDTNQWGVDAGSPHGSAQVFRLPDDGPGSFTGSMLQDSMALAGLGSPMLGFRAGSPTGSFTAPAGGVGSNRSSGRSSFTGASAGLGPVGSPALDTSKGGNAFRTASPGGNTFCTASPGRAMERNNATHTPSKLRNTSVNIANPAALLAGLKLEEEGLSVSDEVVHAEPDSTKQDNIMAAAANQAVGLSEAVQAPVPAGVNSGMDADLAALPRGMDVAPTQMGIGRPPVPDHQQLQAIYLAAAMYNNPYMQQQQGMHDMGAMAAAMQGNGFMGQMNPYTGYPGMAYPGMGYPGMMPGMPFPPSFPNSFLPPGAMPPMMPNGFPPMPGVGGMLTPEMHQTFESMYASGAMNAAPPSSEQFNAMVAAMASAVGHQPQNVQAGGKKGSDENDSRSAGRRNMSPKPPPNQRVEGQKWNNAMHNAPSRTNARMGNNNMGNNNMGNNNMGNNNMGNNNMGNKEQEWHGPPASGNPARRERLNDSPNRMPANSRRGAPLNNNGAPYSHHGSTGDPRAGPGHREGTAERHGVTNAVLEEFKYSHKTRKYELSEILGHVVEFSLDQHGSRFIQQNLENARPEEREAALEEVLPKCLALVNDVFGNYVVQKFLEHGTPAQRLRIVRVLKGHIINMSLQMYGCRVVQKSLELLPVSEQCAIIAEMDDQYMRFVKDQNGNHVIQKIIECVPTDLIEPLLETLMGSTIILSAHPFGCRVIQRVLEHCSHADKKAKVMEEILHNVRQLAQDQYGNYVIQHVMEHGTAEDRETVVAVLAPQMVAMSVHKFASNVVEKALVHGNAEQRDLLIQNMLGATASRESSDTGDQESGGEDPLQQMMKDQFGNYVVQKVLEVCNAEQREALLCRVRAELHALKRYTYGKHIVLRVEKLLSAGSHLQDGDDSPFLANSPPS